VLGQRGVVNVSLLGNSLRNVGGYDCKNMDELVRGGWGGVSRKEFAVGDYSASDEHRWRMRSAGKREHRNVKVGEADGDGC